MGLFEPSNEPSSRLESDSEDEASKSDVQEVDIEKVQGEDMEAWEEDDQSFSMILQMYVENVFGRCNGSLGIIQYSLLLFIEVIPCDESSILFNVNLVGN